MSLGSRSGKKKGHGGELISPRPDLVFSLNWLGFGGGAPDRSLGDLAGLQALGAYADHAHTAVDERTNALKVRKETAGGDTRGLKTDSTGFFGDTAACYLLAGQRFFVANFTNSCHVGLPRKS